MATPSPLTGPALQASRAALSAALADTPSLAESTTKEEQIEPGEIQEVDMQAQAETIRTVFSDPTNFNVKVNNLPL
jgi:translation initiation factor 4E